MAMSKAQQIFNIVAPRADKQFGKNTLMLLSEGRLEGIPVYSTGIPSLDIGLGVGGIPKGRIIEVYGPESSGKTTLALKFLAEVQKVGGAGAVVDAEHALDLEWARTIGVNIGELMLTQPDCGEDALELVIELVKAKTDIIIVDSVSALVPRAEIEGQMGDSHMGLQARMMSQAMRKLVSIVKKNDSMVVFLNQIRMKIGVMFGNPETTSGGNALKFAASVRLDIRAVGKIGDKTIKEGGEASDGEVVKKGKQPYKSKDVGNIIGNDVRIKVVKNKVAPPFKVCNAVLTFDAGFDTAANVFASAVSLGIIEKRGSWYVIGTEQLGCGKEGAIKALRKQEELMTSLYERCVNTGLGIDDDSEEDLAELERIRKLKKEKKNAKRKSKDKIA